jgi:hypothetical protein
MMLCCAVPSSDASAPLCTSRQVIKRMQMLDKGTARIDWQLTGSVGMVPIDLAMGTTITLNLLTGRIISQVEAMDASK